MSQQQNTGEKTEKPTQKKLRDARREGQVAKSKDLTHTAVTLAWIVVLVGFAGWFAGRLAQLLDATWVQIGQLSVETLLGAGISAAKVLVILTVVPLTLVAAVGILVEFLQAGPVLAPKRIAPKPSNIGISQGLKRIFSVDNLFEVIKSIAKTIVLVAIVAIIALSSLNSIVLLPTADVLIYSETNNRLLLLLFVWVVVLFTLFSIADWLYQKYSFERKQRMSKYDIKRENKEQDGDPHTRGARRSLHRQWATQNAQEAARQANAVIVNPTHIAVAVFYKAGETLVPTISAKGEGHLAQLIRESAQEAGVPIVRNINLARTLNFRCEEEDFIPEDLFDAVAEVLVWAENLRRGVDNDRRADNRSGLPQHY